jgi:AcrR family transcriptional regulator
MRKRAEQMEQVRQRIVDAAIELHGTVGPAYTTITDIAEQAGVTRATVYRHFTDEDAIFEACSSHWLSGQVPPDPQAWLAVEDGEQRLRTGLADLFRFYRDGQEMLTRINRDRETLPVRRREAIDARDAHFRQVLLGVLPKNKRVRATLAVATSFWTWRQLCVEQGLSNRDAVDVMTAAVLAARRPNVIRSEGFGVRAG